MGQDEWREGRCYGQNQEKILPGRRSSICQHRGGGCVLRLQKGSETAGGQANQRASERGGWGLHYGRSREGVWGRTESLAPGIGLPP